MGDLRGYSSHLASGVQTTFRSTGAGQSEPANRSREFESGNQSRAVSARMRPGIGETPGGTQNRNSDRRRAAGVRHPVFSGRASRIRADTAGSDFPRTISASRSGTRFRRELPAQSRPLWGSRDRVGYSTMRHAGKPWRIAMKALMLTAYHRLEIQDVAVPEVGPEDVLVKVGACGICGSDVHGMDGSTGRRRHRSSWDTRRPARSLAADATSRAGRGRPGDLRLHDLLWQVRFCRAGKINLCSHRRVLESPAKITASTAPSPNSWPSPSTSSIACRRP